MTKNDLPTDSLDALVEMAEFGGMTQTKTPVGGDPRFTVWGMSSSAILHDLKPGEFVIGENGWRYERLGTDLLCMTTPHQKILGTFLCSVCNHSNLVIEGKDPEFCSKCAINRLIGGWTINGYYIPKIGEGDHNGNSSSK